MTRDDVGESAVRITPAIAFQDCGITLDLRVSALQLRSLLVAEIQPTRGSPLVASRSTVVYPRSCEIRRHLISVGHGRKYLASLTAKKLESVLS